MLTSQLLSRVQNRLQVETGNSALWTPEELIDEYANQVRNRLFQIVRIMKIDSSTASDLSGLPLCTVSVTTGTKTYALSQKILEINRVVPSWGYNPLAKMTAYELDAQYPNWQNYNNGTPFAYCSDLATDSITLVPGLSAATGTLTLTVSRYPLQDLAYDDDTILLDFREEYHIDLIPGILAEAFQKKDPETDRPEMSAFFKKKFEDRANEIAMEMLRRAHNVSRPMRVKSAYSS